MNQGTKPDLLIYHGPSCLDGLGAVWAIHQKWPGVPVHEGVYGQPPPDVTGLRVLVADFSYPEDVLREMAAAAHEITVLDHHKSSMETIAKLLNENVIRGEHDMTRSGAAMAWYYAWGSPHAPKIIEHIQDRDLWRFEVPFTREVTAVLASYPGEGWERSWTEIGRSLEAGRGPEVWAQGAAIMRAHDVDMAKVLEAGRRTMIIGGKRVPVCNAPFFWASEIGHVLAGQSEWGFAATYMDLPNGRQFSLRSADGAEAPVNVVAEEYGGGGHPGAAGFTAPVGWEGDVDQDDDAPTYRLQPGARIPVKAG